MPVEQLVLVHQIMLVVIGIFGKLNVIEDVMILVLVVTVLEE